MGRLGLNTHASEALIQAVDQSPSTFLSSIWTHFANADEPESDFTQIQFDRFMGLMKKMGGAPAPLHCAASAAAYSFPPSIDANLMAKARIGIALYGLLDLPAGRTPTGLQPILEFVSSVSSIKTVMAGTPISYGSRWITGRETRIATVAVGYADGIPTLLSNKGQVRIGGQLFPIVGKVCMDMFMVDLGPESDDSLPVRIGDHVTLYGMNSPTCFEVADLCSSITYVQVCGISNRVPRIYSSNWMT